MDVTVQGYGDSGFKVTISGDDREGMWRAVCRLASRVNSGEMPGLTGAAATYDSVFVEYDPLTTLPDEAQAALDTAITPLDTAPGWERAATFEIPVVYGGEYGPDLLDVADRLGLDPEHLVRAHVSLEHVVRCYSHSATAMLDGPDLPSDVPRLADPRLVVPAGSVSLAGRQAVVLACSQASGWRIIGRTPIQLTCLDAPNLTAFRPGDTFRYRRIHPEDWCRFADTTLESCRV